MKYARDVEHCKKSEYVQEATIKIAEPAHNSDYLERIEFEEIAYEAISQRGSYATGDRVLFVPGDSVLPFDLGEKLNVTNYLSRGRVKTIELRGNRSEGLIIPLDIAKPYRDHILKWENPPRVSTGGRIYSKEYCPAAFKRFPRMPRIQNSPNRFRLGEAILISEKLHGMSIRFGCLEKPSRGWLLDGLRDFLYAATRLPVFDKWQYYVGSHNTVRREPVGYKSNAWWDMFREHIEGKIEKGEVFYGEVYGPGIQKGFSYDEAVPNVRLFMMVTQNGTKTVDPLEASRIAKARGLEWVNYHVGTYKDIKSLRSLSEAPSSYTDKHIREGIVIVSASNGHKMAKFLNFNYLSKDDNERTEYH